MKKKTFGEKLRAARKSKKLTQEALAELAGISYTYLGEVERGIKMPSVNTLIKLVNALNISSDYLLRDEVMASKEYVFDEVTQKLESLSPHQRKTVIDIIDAYIKNL